MKQPIWRKPLLLGTVTAVTAMLILDSAALAIGFTTTYTFSLPESTGNQASEPPNLQPVSGAVFSDITRGSGVQPNQGNNSINSSGWTTENSIDTSDYYEFGIDLNPSYELDLANLAFSEVSSSTGIGNFEIRSSLDNYSTTLFTPTVAIQRGGTVRRQEFSLASSTQLQNLVDDVTFRLYGYSATGDSGTWRLGSNNTQLQPSNLVISGDLSELSPITPSTPVPFEFSPGLGILA